MRRTIVVLTAVIVAAAFALPALAASPHFIRAGGSLNANGH
jgi:hypothetical protein